MPELIWKGKYHADGKKVPQLPVALPFQTIETVNQSALERQKALDGQGGDPRMPMSPSASGGYE